MAMYKVDEASLTAVADAIRAKAGVSEPMEFPNGFVEAVGNIEAGGSDTTIEDGLIDGTISGVYRNDRVTIINNSCFYKSGVTEVYFPNVKTVRGSAFNSCKSLVKADFGSVTTFESMIFNGATALQTLIVRTNQVATLGQMAIAGSPNIYVPASLVDSYKAATNWKSYADTIFAIEDYPDICA